MYQKLLMAIIGACCSAGLAQIRYTEYARTGEVISAALGPIASFEPYGDGGGAGQGQISGGGPVLNNSGQIAALVLYEDFRDDLYRFDTQRLTEATHISTGGHSHAFIQANGAVAVQRAGAAPQLMVVTPGGGEQVIARLNDIAPDFVPQGRFASVGYKSPFAGPVVNERGGVAFVGLVTGRTPPDERHAVWASIAGQLRVAVRSGQAVPGSTSGETFGYLNGEYVFHGGPAINDSGTLALDLKIADASKTVFTQSLWVARPAGGAWQLEEIARANSEGVGLLNEGASINSRGQLAFTDRNAVYLHSDGATTAVARVGDPVTGSSRTVAQIWHTRVTETGAVVFSGRMLDGGVLRHALFLQEGLELRLLDSSLPSIPYFSVNTHGDAAALDLGRAQLIVAGTWGRQTVLRAGDTIDLGEGPQTIEQIHFQTGSNNHDGRASGFNDIGQLAARIAFTDDSESLVLITMPAKRPGDLDYDNVVDYEDFLRIYHNLGRADANRTLGDANYDTLVNMDDYALFKANLLPAVLSPDEAAALADFEAGKPIPEPAALAALGLAAMICRRRVRA